MIFLHLGWHVAMEEELSSIASMGTWTIVSLPSGKVTIPSKWVYKCKPLSATHTRLKAWLVILGNLQKHGIDFHETFSPVVKWTTLRAITAIATAKGWVIFHMHVGIAFLNSDLHDTIYMKQPPGFVVVGRKHYVCLLHTSLYGLHQSS